MLQLCFELESIDNYHMLVRVFVYVYVCLCVYARQSQGLPVNVAVAAARVQRFAIWQNDFKCQQQSQPPHSSNYNNYSNNYTHTLTRTQTVSRAAHDQQICNSLSQKLPKVVAAGLRLRLAKRTWPTVAAVAVAVVGNQGVGAWGNISTVVIARRMGAVDQTNWN